MSHLSSSITLYPASQAGVCSKPLDIHTSKRQSASDFRMTGRMLEQIQSSLRSCWPFTTLALFSSPTPVSDVLRSGGRASSFAPLFGFCHLAASQQTDPCHVWALNKLPTFGSFFTPTFTHALSSVDMSSSAQSITLGGGADRPFQYDGHLDHDHASPPKAWSQPFPPLPR